MSIRSLKKSDNKKHFCNLLSQLTYTGNISEEQFLEKYYRIKSNQNYYICVIEIDKNIIAAGTLFIEDKFIHDCGTVGHIEDIIVDKDQRGKNFGKNIINHLIDKARECGCYKIILNCNEHNKDFYTKLGFMNKELQMALYFT